MKYKIIDVTTVKYIFKNKSKSGINYKLNPSFGKGIKKVNENIYDLYLSFSLHDDGENLSPYDIDMEIVGEFEIKDGDENEKESFMNLNAVSILFPYLRSILSSSMSSMMTPPIVLPIVDAKELFNKKN